MKQGNPQKKMGRVAMLAAMISGMLSTGNKAYTMQMMQEKSMLLTNGGRAPIPGKMLNQRQKRKRYRQSHTYS